MRSGQDCIASATKRVASCAWLLFLAGGAPAATAAPPGEAQAVIDRVHAAAVARDYDRLSALMTAGFKMSFGPEGDTDRERAIAAWRQDPRALEALARATAGACGFDAGSVSCPADAGTAPRAGFDRASGDWRMSSFLGGD